MLTVFDLVYKSIQDPPLHCNHFFYFIASQQNKKYSSIGTSLANTTTEVNMKEFSIPRQYLKEIRRYPLLTPEQEKELAQRIEKGDNNAKKNLIECNLRLVVKIALSFYKGRVPLMDIIQNGNLGLMHAAEKFDYRKNIRFASYASFWIRQSILRHLASESHTETISIRTQEKKKHIRSFIENYFSLHSRFPTVNEIVACLNVKPFEASEELSFCIPQNHDHPLPSLEEIADNFDIENEIERQNLIEDIQTLFNELDEENKTLIKMRYGFDSSTTNTLATIAESLGMTAEGVRQRENRILASFRKKNPHLRYYFA